MRTEKAKTTQNFSTVLYCNDACEDAAGNRGAVVAELGQRWIGRIVGVLWCVREEFFARGTESVSAGDFATPVIRLRGTRMTRMSNVPISNTVQLFIDLSGYHHST